MTKEEILTLVRTTACDHSLDSHPCDLCGTHYSCSTCRDDFLSSDHTVDMIIEVLEKVLD